jgi:hypothetical protein
MRRRERASVQDVTGEIADPLMERLPQSARRQNRNVRARPPACAPDSRARGAQVTDPVLTPRGRRRLLPCQAVLSYLSRLGRLAEDASWARTSAHRSRRV